MNRNRYRWSEAIRFAEARTGWTVPTDWFTGADPVSAGLHRGVYRIADGRRYQDTPHSLFPHHATDNRYTIVLPERPARSVDDIETIIHESGHILYESRALTRVVEPVSLYAETNEREAFAEGFVRWVLPESEYGWWDCKGLSADDASWYASLPYVYTLG